MPIIIVTITFLVFLFARAKLLMIFFQQDEYNNIRFLNFTFRNLRLVDKKLTVVLLLLGILAFIAQHFQSNLSLINLIDLFYLIIFLTLIVFFFLQLKLAKNARKALVQTARVKRILSVFGLLYVLLLAVVIYLHLPFNFLNSPFVIICPISSFIILTQLTPLMLVLSNILLSPLEKWSQNKFLTEAKEKLARINPTIIGITGSYGKTSTKHILSHITSSSVPIFFPAGGINTPMGITRVIREKLKPEHKFFVSEMGAYGRGSIERICNLTPPTYGIITAVGKMHFERFKSQETIAQTKFELAEAVFKKGGKLVINAELVDRKYIEHFTARSQKDVILVARKKDPDYQTCIISDEKLTVDGVTFKLELNGEVYELQCPIYGLHQITNIAEAFVMSTILGIAPETIVASLKTMPQIQHRLEVLRNPNTAIVIDDIYNSNPVGFRSALGVLNILKRPKGRRILVTPGMVELGEIHEQEHFTVGQEIGRVADVLVAVIPKRIKSLIDGFKSTADLSQQKLVKLDTAKEVKTWVAANAKPEDVILYENDLLDLYESKVRL